MDQTAPRKRGRPRKAPDPRPIPDTGALDLADRLLALDNARRAALDVADQLTRTARDRHRHRQPATAELADQSADALRIADQMLDAMHRAYTAWLAQLAERADQDGPEGDDFAVYLETLRAVALDNTPDLTPEARYLALHLHRATSPRRDARAYAKALRDSLDSRAARGLPPVPILDALTAAALDHAKGKGGGDDSHIEHRPAMDHALLLAYESGAEAEYLLTTHGMGAARRASVLDMECAPDPDERDTYANDKSLCRALGRARRPRDIARQCLEELTLLCDFLPQLTPPHLRPEALAAAARAQVSSPAAPDAAD